MKVLVVFGTRPEAIKMAPLLQKMQETSGLEPILCVTAQHREMLDQVLDLFEMTPDYDLNIMKANQTISQITAHVVAGLDEVMRAVDPAIVLVHGDTTTTFAAALAAFYHQKPVGHVEAGLRTGDRYSPFPEETNRALTARLACLHFAPTPRNRQNLLREGIAEETIFVTGNTVVDALQWVARKPYDFSGALAGLDFAGKRVITVTCHRRENLGAHMEAIFAAIKQIADDFADVEVVYPVHLNPRVRETADKILKGHRRIHLIEPLSYQPFVNLMAKSYLILTDSGGMQEEAPALGKPVLVARKETERPEAIEAGTAKLAGVSRETIYDMTKTLLVDPEEYQKMARAVNPYGDGLAAERIVDILTNIHTEQKNLLR